MTIKRMLRDTIQQDVNVSLKAGKKDRVETLRYLLSAVRNSAINKYGAESETKLTDEDVVDVVKKQIKTHKESVEAFQKAGRTDLVDKENIQLEILKEFAPKELSDEELKKMLLPIIASGEVNFGKLMGQAMSSVGKMADGGKVASILKQLLSSK
jgi:uncharacterized protein YqeY